MYLHRPTPDTRLPTPFPGGTTMWTGLALFLTVCMGGIIAYNGDVIGRRYGKRRVTMFGLRPKYTAILVTSVTGVLISAGTTIVLFLLVPQVRNVIMNGEYAIAQNRSLEKKITANQQTL